MIYADQADQLVRDGHAVFDGILEGQPGSPIAGAGLVAHDGERLIG